MCQSTFLQLLSPKTNKRTVNTPATADVADKLTGKNIAPLDDKFKKHRVLTLHFNILPIIYSHLNESLDFQIIFEYFLFTYSDVDIRGRHVANVVN